MNYLSFIAIGIVAFALTSIWLIPYWATKSIRFRRLFGILTEDDTKHSERDTYQLILSKIKRQIEYNTNAILCLEDLEPSIENQRLIKQLTTAMDELSLARYQLELMVEGKEYEEPNKNPNVHPSFPTHLPNI